MRLQARINAVTIIGLSLFWLLFFGYPDTAQAMDEAEAVPSQIIVQLQQGVTIDAVNQTYQTVTVSELVPGTGIYLLQTPDGSDVETLLSRMAADPRIIYAEPNLLAEAPEAVRSKDWGWGGQDAQPYASQYALSSINLADAHSYSTGANTIIAVVDTGVQLDHPALAGRITAVQADFVDGDGVANDEPNGQDDDGDGEVDESTGHGTHVAGIVHLVAPDARIMPVRALDSDGGGSAFLVAEAILFAVEHGADVINLSLGTSEESDLLEDVIEEAAERGVLVIAAAGNLGTTQAVYPAADECALAITSIGPTDRRSSFASYGRWVDLAAPGESIYSPFPVNGYAWWSGTSMAAPFAAGQAALLRSYDASLGIRDVADLLGGTATSVNLTNQLRMPWLGAGKINISASLAALAEGRIPSGLELIDEDCAGAPVTPPANSTCEGYLEAITVDNLQVPQGASCTLTGTHVTGSIQVAKDASLKVYHSTVVGNIQADGARLIIILAGSTVGGSIQIKESDSVRVENVSVNRDLQFEMVNAALSVFGNQVGGNLQAFKNAGSLTIANNIVDGNLQCKENTLSPAGGNNIVRGNKEDQCADL
jgi:hypothetical protein